MLGPADDALARKGHPVRADFLLWLEPRPPRIRGNCSAWSSRSTGTAATADYREPDAHLDELGRYGWYVESRGVFSRVCAEVSGEEFELSPTLAEYLPAFTSRDKPFYKLCQAASYVDTTHALAAGQGLRRTDLSTRAPLDHPEWFREPGRAVLPAPISTIRASS